MVQNIVKSSRKYVCQTKLIFFPQKSSTLYCVKRHYNAKRYSKKSFKITNTFAIANKLWFILFAISGGYCIYIIDFQLCFAASLRFQRFRQSKTFAFLSIFIISVTRSYTLSHCQVVKTRERILARG